MKMRKILSAMLAAVCVCMLTACGSDSGNNGGSGDSEKEETKKIEVTKPEDLADLTIGVQQGTTGDLFVSDITEPERFNKGMEAVMALSQSKLDAVVIDNEPAKVFVSEVEGLKILDEAFAEEEYAIAVAKDNTELVEKINTALAELKEDGTLQTIIDKYITAE